MTTAAPLSALVIMRPFFFAGSFIAVSSLYVKLDFNFFVVGYFIKALISFSTRPIYVLTCVSYGATCIYGLHVLYVYKNTYILDVNKTK